MAVESTDRRQDLAGDNRRKELSSDTQPQRRGGYESSSSRTDLGLSVLLDPNPYMATWRSGESPRGAYSHGLLASLHSDPTYYRDGYGISCGFEEHEMGGFDFSATCTSSSSDLDFIFPDSDVFIADDFSSNAGNSQSNDKISIVRSAAGIDIANDSNTKGKGSKLFDREVKNVFRGKLGTNAAEEAAKLLRLLQRTNDNSRLTIPTTIDSPSYDHSINGGGCLFEVFSVRINRINNNSNSRNDCSDIYGGITVQHSECYFGGTYIFHRLQSDAKCISLYDDTLSLVGPGHVIVYYGYFRLTLDLKDKDGDLFPNDVRNRSFGLEDYEMSQIEYGKLMSEEFHGKFGSATVYYTIFDNAIKGSVNVELFKGDRVYGSIVAHYSHYDYSADEQMKYYQSVLFYRPRSNYVKLQLCKLVPIFRVVAVPISSSLIIEVDLWNISQLNNDDQIAKGTAVFPPQANGKTSVRDIKGDNCFARVTVAWRSSVYWR